MVLASVLGGLLVRLLDNPIVEEALAGLVAGLAIAVAIVVKRQLQKLGVDLSKAQEDKLAGIVEDAVLLAEEVVESEIKEKVAGGAAESVVREAIKGKKLDVAVVAAAKSLEKAGLRPVGKLVKRALKSDELRELVLSALPKISLKNGLKIGASISKRF